MLNHYLQLSDEELVHNIKENNCRTSLDALLQKHMSLIQTLVNKAEKNKELQEDVLQDCLLKVIAGIKSFRGDSQFSTWLYRVVINALAGYVKSEIRRPNTISIYNDVMNDDDFTSTEFVESLVDENGMDYEPHILKEMQSVTDRVIDIIRNCRDKRYRDVLELHFIQDKSDEESAEILGLPVGTVKSRIHYSRKYLRNKMVREGMLEDYELRETLK